MNHFDYRSVGLTGGLRDLHCEGVALREIADAVGTPAYVYSSATLERHYTLFRDAFAPWTPLIAYAVKANGSLSVLSTLAKLGAGADTVSEGEIRRALAAGVPASRIVFSGVGKTAAELAFALEVGVAEINVESEPELLALGRIAAAEIQPLHGKALATQTRHQSAHRREGERQSVGLEHPG
jgi:diaminopimelate decarboxylase